LTPTPEQAARLSGPHRPSAQLKGVGRYARRWVASRRGRDAAGHGNAYHMLAKLKEAFDPNGIMNKGTIFPLDA
jgi:FAD/FMN-containing dehydrogenase